MALTLLHLSDIHFKNYKEHEYLDLDKDIQNELEQDLARIKYQYNSINTILIGGDIAFSGQQDQYKTADVWINKICQITGCREEDVLTVPGNHDVDRTKISGMVKDLQAMFKGMTDRANIDRKLTEYLTSIDSSNVLLGPFTNYNNFAQKYGCIPVNGNLLYWVKDFSLNPYILRIRGVNSALISNETDHEQSSKLVLGSQQSLVPNGGGIINVVLCHHPPPWLIDGDHVSKDLKVRANLCLFGHKHEYDTEKINDTCLIISAGAMQPSRSETSWEPRYNIIQLNVTISGNKNCLHVRLFRRVWNKRERKFKAENSDSGKMYAEYYLELPELGKTISVLQMPATVEIQNTVTMPEDVIDLNNPNPVRKLSYMFLGLPYHLRITIAAELKIIEDSDNQLNVIQQSQKFFQRAVEKNLLRELWEKVVPATGQNLNNPF